MKKIVLAGTLVAIIGFGIVASQNAVVRNLGLLMDYERTLDTYSQTDTTVTTVDAVSDLDSQVVGLVSAFFGLDNDLPYLFSLASCVGAGGMDGMPIMFTHEVDITTLEPRDLRITTSSDKPGTITCLTMAPADDPGERRTALLIGEFGSIEDQPVRVEVVGNVLSIDGTRNFRGASVPVTPLESGPSLVFGEIVPEVDWALGRLATRLPWGGGSGCPIGTTQVVRVAWDGGIRKTIGGDADQALGALYEVTVQGQRGERRVVRPVALADLGDGDNNHSICLDVRDPAVSVFLPAGKVIDPRGDVNADTTINIRSGV